VRPIDFLCTSGTLTRTSHQLSTAAMYPSVLTALRSVGLLDVLHE
jgi:hypothetical protein